MAISTGKLLGCLKDLLKDLLLGPSFGGDGTMDGIDGAREGIDGVLTIGEEEVEAVLGGCTAGEVRRVVSPVAVELSEWGNIVG